jgi:dTDP-4-amino-4,6-dideoxygalactose transaminase
LIIDNRRRSWARYESALNALEQRGDVSLPNVPRHCEHNGHIFYIKVADLETRSKFIAHMNSAGIQCVSHYVPLHSAVAGAFFATFHGEDRYTTSESERLVRLPLFFGISDEEIERVVEGVRNFFVA